MVIVGRSLLVGKPLLALLNNLNATVTFVGRHTKKRATLTRQADIKAGAVVIDVGINRLPSGKLVGDVDFASVVSQARLITPVLGGVGPLTVAMLMRQTVELAEWRRERAAFRVG